MPQFKYSPLSLEKSPEEYEEGETSPLEKDPGHENRLNWRESLQTSIIATAALVAYSILIAWITKAVLQVQCHQNHLPDPGSSFPHPDEKHYIITETGRHDEKWLHHLVYGKPSTEVDEAWYDLLKPFNTRVPAERYEATMAGRLTVRLADGSGDYYVTLTMYHELHCLMRFRWFLDPEYYANMTWEEQANDPRLMGHYRHCILSLLESVLCNGDTSMRTFHWDPTNPKPVPDSLTERKKLSHPTFGLLDEKLRPVKGVDTV
ncbi:hypothetical protein VTK26DRAFT_3967 [Humicola hyalothermophila]